MVSWKCSKCGYTLDADIPPNAVPGMQAKMRFFGHHLLYTGLYSPGR